MEYLMTYGWAILVIAVVLGVLFQLGVFGGANLAPKATPGSCEVQHTTSGASLEGMCQGEMPQYVAAFGGGTITIPYSTTLPAYGPFTVSMWFMTTNSPSITYDAWLMNTRGQGGSDGTYDMQLCGGGWCGVTSGIHGDIGTGCANCWLSTSVNYQFTFSQGTWYHVTTEFTGTGWSVFLDGKNVSSGTYSSNTPSMLDSSDNIQIGAVAGGSVPFEGDIANVQVYNTSLSAAEILALYQEGIGGAPVRPQNIAGWWPLNGNANDYSGNNNNGQGTNIGYSSFWTNGYSAP